MLLFHFALSLFCVNATYAIATPQPRDLIPLADYNKLLKLCQNGGPNAYVGVRYGDDLFTTFNFDACYPYQIGEKQARQAVFCKSVTCYNNPKPDCTGGVVPPVPIPVLEGLTLPNAEDWVQLLGQGATCQRNGLSKGLSGLS